MPYKIQKAGSKYKVVTSDTGRVHGTFPTKAKAVKQLRALYKFAPPGKGK